MANKWTLEKIKEGFEKFYKAEERYPTSVEIDNYHFLPSSRQIQRRFGGLPTIRKELGLKGPTDFTKGEYSSERSRTIGKRAHKVELEVYTYLANIFGKPFVHKEHFFSDDKRARSDFYIYCKDDNFSVDTFYPSDRKNLIGCLNSKLRTYGNSNKNVGQLESPIIFLMMNKDIREEIIEEILEKKVNKLNSMESVMTFEEFKKYCKKKIPM